MKTTIAVVGLGSIARKAHLPVLTAHPAVEIVALASQTGARIDDLASQYRLTLQARTLEEILALKPDAAYVLSSTAAHPAHAIALLQADIAVYMEKPLADDLASARAIAQTAAEGKAPLMVGFNRRYAPAYRRARELFTGRRGPELIQLTKHRNGSHESWPLRQLVMDDTIHIIDLARFFGGTGGDAPHVTAAHARHGLIAAQMLDQNGTVTHLSQTYGAGTATERVELHGGGLSVIVEEMERLRVIEGGVERVETVGGSWTSTLEKKGMAGATEHFLTCLRTGAKPDTDAAEALKTQELAEAILVGGAR